jgi:hypothetical protein
LTASGRELADAALAGLLKNERDLLATLEPERLSSLAGLLRSLTLPFDSA